MSDLRRRRPWLAVLLAVLISGLGHAYLRRWGRALGWYVAITATLVLFVPDAAMDQLIAREAPPVADIAPALVVIAASIVDAYVLAIRNNREYERQQRTKTTSAGQPGGDGFGAGFEDGSIQGSETSAGVSSSEPAGAVTAADPTAEPPTIDCPHCGRETDADIDFCHWCTEPLDRSVDSDVTDGD